MPGPYNKIKLGNDTLIDLTSDTVTKDAVLDGVTFHDASGSIKEGTIPTVTTDKTTLDCSEVATIPAGYIDSNITITANSLASQTPSDATSSEVLTTKSGWVNGVEVNGSMPENNDVSGSISTKTGTVTIPAGHTSGGTIAISSAEQANIIPDNIAKDITILGVTGTHEGGVDVSDTTAVADDVAYGDIFYTADGTRTLGARKYAQYIDLLPTSTNYLYTPTYITDSGFTSISKSMVDMTSQYQLNFQGLTLTPAEVDLGMTFIGSTGKVEVGTKPPIVLTTVMHYSFASSSTSTGTLATDETLVNNPNNTTSYGIPSSHNIIMTPESGTVTVNVKKLKFRAYITNTITSSNAPYLAIAKGQKVYMSAGRIRVTGSTTGYDYYPLTVLTDSHTVTAEIEFATPMVLASPGTSISTAKDCPRFYVSGRNTTLSALPYRPHHMVCYA